MAPPPFTLSRKFFHDFTEADAPCCGLGLVRSCDAITGFFAMKPECVVPNNVLEVRTGFGHRMLISPDGEPVSQFSFEFRGFERHSVLVNPSSPLVLKAIETMVKEGDFFCFILNPDGRAFAFRRDLGEENVAGMRDSLPLMRSTRTPQSSYESGVRAFQQTPNPREVKPLEWVCREDPAYLDLEADTVDFPPPG